MIIKIAGLTLKVDIKGDGLRQIEGSMRKTFEDFILSGRKCDLFIGV